MDNKITNMDIKPNKEVTFDSKWSAEKMLTEFARHIFGENINDPLKGIRKDDHIGYALNIEEGLEFAFIKCCIPNNLSIIQTANQDLETLTISYFFDSTFDYYVDNEKEQNMEGLINGIVIHNYATKAKFTLKKGQEFSYVMIVVKKNILAKYFGLVSDQLTKILFSQKPVHYYENLNPDILSYLSTAGRLNSSNNTSRYLIFSKAIGLLALTFNSLLEREKESSAIERISVYEKVINARNYLVSDWTKPTTVRRLSHFMGMSQTNAKLVFKQVFGYPVNHYFKIRKMQLAYQLIQETNDDIIEISRRLGYKNPSHFSSDFKKHFGILPKKLSMQLKKDLS